MTKAALYVNYFSEEDICKSLGIFRDYFDYILVVSNSGRTTLEASVDKVLISKNNVGFGSACATGVEYLLEKNIECVTLINPDIFHIDISKQEFSELLTVHNSKELDFVQPLVLNRGVAHSVQGLKSISFWILCLAYTPVKFLFLKGYLRRFINYGEADELTVFSGAFVTFLNRKALEVVANTKFKSLLYFEEVHWARAFSENSLRGSLDRTFSVKHEVGSTTGLRKGKGSPKMLLERRKSFILVFQGYTSVKRKIGIGIAFLDYIIRRVWSLI